MTIRAIKNAEAAALRFLAAVKRANCSPEAYVSSEPYILASKESGNLRRASMDLTRALADLRAGR